MKYVSETGEIVFEKIDEYGIFRFGNLTEYGKFVFGIVAGVVYTITLADSIKTLDSKSLSSVKILSESVKTYDKRIHSLAKNLKDSVSFRDLMYKKFVINRLEELILYDSVLYILSRALQVLLIDSIKLADTIKKVIDIKKLENLRIVDRITELIRVQREDIFRLTDKMFKKQYINRYDLLKMLDSVTKNILLSRKDLLSLSDYLSYLINRILSVTLTDEIKVFDARNIRYITERLEILKLIDKVLKEIHLYRVEYIKSEDLTPLVEKYRVVVRKGLLLILDDVIIDLVNKIVYVVGEDIAF